MIVLSPQFIDLEISLELPLCLLDLSSVALLLLQFIMSLMDSTFQLDLCLGEAVGLVLFSLKAIGQFL